MDKVTTEILERLLNGDSRSTIAREMDIPEYWITEAVEEFNREYQAPTIDMMGNIVDDRPMGMN
jgi:hypothetical protein